MELGNGELASGRGGLIFARKRGVLDTPGSQGRNSYVFGSSAMSQANDYFFARKREKKIKVFFFARQRAFFYFFFNFFCFSRVSAEFFLGLFFAMSQAKPGISALPEVK